MNSLAAKRAMSSYQNVERTKRDTNNPQELVSLLFTGLTDRIASARKALADERSHYPSGTSYQSTENPIWFMSDS
jgi:flagellin-specific chaperone FliS